MFQVGHVQHRGAGAFVVSGPLGVAVVSADLVSSALEVVNGQLDPARFATYLAGGGHTGFLLDLATPLPLMTLQGQLTVRAWHHGQDDPQPWTGPFLGAQLDPAALVALDVIADESAAGAWLPLWHGAAAAGSVRIGHPGAVAVAWTAADPSALGVAGPASGVPVSPAHPSETPVSPPTPAPVPPAEPDAATPAAPTAPPVTATPAAPVPAATGPAAAFNPEATYPQGHLLAQPAAGAPTPTSAASAASAPPLSPYTFPTPTTAGQPTDNPELYEATISQAQLAQLRTRPAEPAAPPPAARRIPVLVFAGMAPVAATGDVVIGRDPDMRALNGRPPATTLRVPSPSAEISRSHCVVLADANGPATVMDLGSSNGTVLRHPDGRRQELTAFVPVDVAEGDSLDLGEGVVIEVRGRDA